MLKFTGLTSFSATAEIEKDNIPPIPLTVPDAPVILDIGMY